MGKRNPYAKWILPTVIEPATSVCYIVPVPNDKFHIAAFQGAIQSLASWYNWQEDVTHKAKDAAAVWRAIADNLTQEVCNPLSLLEFRMPDLCTIEFSIDGGETWNLVANVEACADAKVRDLVQEWIDDGTLAGGQPGPGGSVGPGFCKTYHVTLNANGQWVAPIPIQANYVIVVSNVSGQTWDGGVGTPYHTGEGREVFLGFPGALDAAEATDPIPGSYHQRLIMRYDGDFYDGYLVNHEVPSNLVGTHELTFQINDSPISDNDGQLRFDVEICNEGTFGLYVAGSTEGWMSIQNIDTLKWHVNVYDVFPENPGFNPYGNINLVYGQISPGPQTQECVRWIITNMTGWSHDSDHAVFTRDDFDCDNVGQYYVGENPAITTNVCKKGWYSRSNTPYSFDVEIVDDCS